MMASHGSILIKPAQKNEKQTNHFFLKMSVARRNNRNYRVVPYTPKSLIKGGAVAAGLATAAAIGRAVYNNLSNARSFGTQTSSRKGRTQATQTSPPKKFGSKSSSFSTNTRSGGFFKKSSRKGYRRYKKRYTATRKGLLATFETGGIITDTDCVYIGHSTMPPNRIQYMMLHAIVKAVFNNMGIYPQSVDLALTNTIIDDVFRLVIRANDEAGTVETNIDFTFLSVVSPETIVNALMNKVAFQDATNQVVFVRAEYFPHAANTDLPYKKIILTNAKLVINAKSSLKIQNRSIGEAGDEESTEVDNCPLTGKCYSGYGNGTQYVNHNSALTPFIAHKTYGVLAKFSENESTDEPPIPQHFSNVRGSSKVKLDPGEIKTTTLVSKGVYPFYRLGYSLFGDVSSGVVQYKKTNLGKFEFFGLERMITVTGMPVLNCAYEQNLEISAYLIGGYPPATARIFEQNFLP